MRDMKHKMIIMSFLYFPLFLIFLACSGNKHSLPQKAQEKPNMKAFQNTIAFREIALFSDCEKYDNNLSSIASDITFIKISPDPPLDDFWRIHSIEVGKEYILISGIHSIFMYDKSGNFLRNIGIRGNVPKEFIQLSNIQIDENAQKIYTLDVRRKRIIIYDFEVLLMH